MSSAGLEYPSARHLTCDRLGRIRIALRLGQYADAAVIEELLEHIDALEQDLYLRLAGIPFDELT